MGYAFVIGSCCICKETFTFNPIRVPSLRIKGTKEPICKICMENINRLRKKNDLEPFSILPDAYEACREEEL
jgi:hypothetical protein